MTKARQKAALLRAGKSLGFCDHDLVFRNGEFLETGMGCDVDTGHYFYTVKRTWKEALAYLRGNAFI